ncbi:MAG: TIGR04255 family protein [Luteimonas sp.]
MSSSPKRLGRDPILEALCEIRFQGAAGKAGTLLPGLLFQRFNNSLPTFERLPAADIPEAIRALDSNLTYAPQYRLAGESGVISIGDRMLSVAVRAPYPGWNNFSHLMRETIAAALDTGVIGLVERFSVKYVNLLEVPEGSAISDVTRVKIELGDDVVNDLQPVHVRRENKHYPYANVVQLAFPASVTIPGREPVTGLVLDIDVINSGPFPDFSATFPHMFDLAHEEEKTLFFSLLTKEALERYEPEY